LALVFVALATGLALLVQHLISAPNVTLIYVLPVIISATLFGWGPSLLAVAVGVIAFDFFFTEPYYSLTMTKPSEIWAAVLLFVIASIVTSVAAQSRRRAMEAREAAERAQALQALAHTVIEGRSQSQILQAAATALHRIFRAPAAILMQCENRFEAVYSGKRTNYRGRPGGRAGRPFVARTHPRGYLSICGRLLRLLADLDIRRLQLCPGRRFCACGA